MSDVVWTDTPRLSAGMTLREDGDMRLRSDGLVQDVMLQKRRAFLAARFPDVVIAASLPVHGAVVGTVTGNETVKEGHALFPQTDALVTAVPRIALTVTVADCLPVYFFDPVRGAIGLAHAGWRGLVAPPDGILAATVETLVALGSRPADLRAEIGPSVGPCHYAVDTRRRTKFSERFGTDVVSGKALDLRRTAVRALTEAGLDRKRIVAEPPCTVCQSDRFFSRRADGRDPPEVGMAWIMLCPAG